MEDCKMAEIPIKYCFFDFDGTLGDTYNGIRNAWLQTIAENNLECPDFDRVFRVGPPAEMIVHKLFPEASDEKCAELAAAYKRCYDNSEQIGEKPYPWSQGILDFCRDAKFKLYVVTYKRFKSTWMLTRRYGFENYFDGMFCTDILPGQMFHKAELLKVALKVTGASPDECVMIGDTELDVLAGKEAGMRTIAVSWGYGSAASLQASKPDFIAGNSDEFLGIFRKNFC